ncbi:circumsporozoite protein-like [Setaria italica]|uniref:circumsporozoite protein-like n=1 Tax=Setaria italica TaxID=4555 RepID=UPI0006466EBC|nr:circumsporozoite protein-like [Setaria italica]
MMLNNGDSQRQQELQPPRTGNDAISEAVAVDPAVARLTGTSFEAAAMDHLKPVVGMMFDTLTDVEKFYKSYAHEASFFVRVGQHKKQNDEILFKRMEQFESCLQNTRGGGDLTRQQRARGCSALSKPAEGKGRRRPQQAGGGQGAAEVSGGGAQGAAEVSGTGGQGAAAGKGRPSARGDGGQGAAAERKGWQSARGGRAQGAAAGKGRRRSQASEGKVRRRAGVTEDAAQNRGGWR